jgi:putative ABC transport system ATP-binding protein
MDIRLRGVVPLPLKDKLSARPSDIWDRSLTFATGKWIKIKAPSGTGKTTLMNILYKIRHDYEGEINWGHQNLKNILNDDLAMMRQQKVSIIFQDLRLFENLTARENIELKRVLQSPFYPADKIDEMAIALGIASILNQKAGVCSYGEQQRIAIIRALVQPYEWLIMDEPFSHLDIANTGKAAALIAQECRKRNAGFILTGLDEDAHFPYDNLYSL